MGFVMYHTFIAHRMKSIISDELLFDYFANRVTALQREQIANWMREPANEEQFFRCLHEWECQKPQYSVDLDERLALYQDFLNGKPSLTESVRVSDPLSVSFSSGFFQRWPLWMAASLLLVLGIGGWFFYDPLFYQTITTNYGETRSLYLPDGSKVALNANSSLRWPRFGFGTNSRNVQLSGEAKFAVTHLRNNQRFVVKTAKGVEVVVLGTEFTVFARSRETKVVLEKGKVVVQYPTATKQTQKLTLKPGDLVSFDQTGKPKRGTTSHPRDFAAWQQHQFVFDNTSLNEVSQLLSEIYNVQVFINDEELSAQTLTGSFHANSPDELLQAIANVMNINVVRHNEKIILTDTNQ